MTTEDESPDTLLTRKEAAARLGVSLRVISRLTKTGRLPSQLITPRAGAPYHLIRAGDLAAVQGRKAGRPTTRRAGRKKKGEEGENLPPEA